jgi:hypothetical protein
MSGSGEIVLATRFISKVLKSLKETAEAKDEYRKAIEFLSSLEQTLQNLTLAGKVLPDNPASQEIVAQTKRIVDVLKPLYHDLTQSESSLGPSASSNATTRLKSKLKWTFQQSKKMEEFEDTVSLPLATINANIGMQIMYVLQGC